MALAHLIRLLKSFIRTVTESYQEAVELRRLMSRRHPQIEEE